VRVDAVRETDLPDLLPLMSDYCTFYEADPGVEKLEALARALLARPAEGMQFIARDETEEAVGFATVYWTWNTLVAARVGVLHDLFVRTEFREHGVGRALIYACVEKARHLGAVGLEWDTAPDNGIAQRLYDTLPGVKRSDWMSYWLDVPAE
jgi:GNAT superfamily N-acetyltransferase